MYDVYESTLGTVLDKAQKEENSIKKIELISWLGCSQNARFLKDLLSQAIKTGSKLNPFDVVNSVVNGSPMGSQIALDFILKNIKKLAEL